MIVADTGVRFKSMRFLPTNIVCLRTLRRGIALRLLALPYFSTLFAIWRWPANQRVLPDTFASHVASALGLSTEQAASAASTFAAVALGLASYLVGWAVNAILLATYGKFSASQVVQVIANCQLPASWRNESADEIIAAADSQRSAQRAYVAGTTPFRFIVLRGGVGQGSLAFVLVHIVLNLVRSQPIVWADLPWKLGAWIALCTLNAAWAWRDLS